MAKSDPKFFEAVISVPSYGSDTMMLVSKQADTKKRYAKVSSCVSFEDDQMD